MQLDESQLEEFDSRGYLFFPNLLDADEVAVLQRAVPEILSREGPEVVRERDDESTARLAFGAHVYSEPFKRLLTLPATARTRPPAAPRRRLPAPEQAQPQARLRQGRRMGLAPGLPALASH